jgi:hypothetical protein
MCLEIWFSLKSQKFFTYCAMVPLFSCSLSLFHSKILTIFKNNNFIKCQAEQSCNPRRNKIHYEYIVYIWTKNLLLLKPLLMFFSSQWLRLDFSPRTEMERAVSGRLIRAQKQGGRFYAHTNPRGAVGSVPMHRIVLYYPSYRVVLLGHASKAWTFRSCEPHAILCVGWMFIGPTGPPE